jgi:alkylation response protein AidB-like acyl-CoA dehydrogenase
MDFQLNEEQQMIHQMARDFAEKELKPRAAETDESGHLPMEAIKKMAPLGLLGLPVPEEYGGPGIDSISGAIVIEEIGRACGSTGLSIAAHNGLGLWPVVAFGTEAQKHKWIPRLMSGETLGALALTEPGAGSDLAGGVRTTAVKEGDNWLIKGSKAWITNASHAEIIITLCRTDPQAGYRGMSLILVEADQEGLIIHPKETKMGVRGCPTHAITYEDVRVPLENLLGEEGRGFHQTMMTLDEGRIGIGALSVGLAQAALEEATRYAKERVAFGKPIAEHQAIQWMIADMATEIEAARTLAYRAAWLKDQGHSFTKEAAMAKLFASEAAERAAFKAIQIHGSYGYSTEYPIERIYRDQRLMTIGEGTSEMQRLVISRRVLADCAQQQGR